MQKILACVIALVFLFPEEIYSQKHIIDSLQNALQTAPNDTVKIKILHKLSWKLKDTEPEKSKSYLASILQIVGKPENKANKEQAAFFTRYTANAHLILGLICTRQGNYEEAMKEQKIAKDLGQQFHDTKIMADAVCNIGIVYYMQGNFPQALENYLNAMRLSDEGKDRMRIANLSNNIGGIYIHMHDTDKAWEFYTKSLNMNKELKNPNGICNAYSNLGLILKNKHKLEEALRNFSIALSVAVEIDNREKIAANYDNISNVYFLQGKSDSSLAYNFKSVEIYKYIQDDEGLGTVYGNMASTYLTLKQFNKALSYALEAREIGRAIKSKYMLKDTEGALTEIFSAMGKDKEALESYKLCILYKDSLSNEENTKKMVQADMQYEFDKKEAVTKAEQEKKEAVAAADSKRQKIIIWSICGVLILVGGFAAFAYRSYIQKKKANAEIIAQKHIIEEKQKEILDSIYYARRIQRALLPTEKYIDKNLN